MKKLLILLASVVISGTLPAQTRCAGLFNSLKGFGLSVSNKIDEDEFNSLELFADFYGLLSGRSEYPGIKFNYTHSKVLKTWIGSDIATALYAGPGVTAGYVRDYQKGYYELRKFVFTQNYGAAAGLSGTIGFRFLFSRRISIDLSWTAELGLHLRKDEKLDTFQLRFYRNGLFLAPYPQLKLEYFF